MMRRVAAAFRMLRPRTIAETGHRVARMDRALEHLRSELADLHGSLKTGRQCDDDRLIAIERQLTAVRDTQLASLQDLQRQMTTLTQEVSQLRLQGSQLRAIATRDAALERRLRGLAQIMDEGPTAEHVRSRIAASPLHLHPFPYMVVDELLPRPLYRAVLEAIPPVELFADRPVNKRQVGVPLTLGPEYSRRVWSFVAQTVAPRMITPPVLETFREPLRVWLEASLGAGAVALLDGLDMSCTDGRILLRGRGYRIPPHRDQKWGFITCLLYLARPDDDCSLGTQLHSVDEDDEAPNAKPHWILPDRCRLEATVEFQPNRALIFLNSSGAHGAQIPAEAPESLERYLYQFRIGPGRGQIRVVLDSLAPEYRTAWEGKISDY